MVRRVGLLPVIVFCGLFGPSGVAGQTGEVRIDLGLARSFPPAGTDAIEASYGMVGLSAERLWDDGSGFGFSVMGGRALTDLGSDWVSLQLVGEVWGDVARGLEVGLGARGSAFRVGRPFVYETNTGELFPQVRLTRGGLGILLRGETGFGGSYFAFHRRDGGVRRASPELWDRGATLEVSSLAFSGLLTVGGGLYEGVAGNYSRVFAAYTWSGPVRIRAGTEAWDTPAGRDISATLGMEVTLGELFSLRVQGGKSEPDPLIRTPQGRHGGSMVGVRLFDLGRRDARVVAVNPASGGAGYRVVFAIPSEGYRSVHLLGDFSSWEPVPLEASGGQWVAELILEPGVYHFGFEVDGVWVLPDGTPGVVSDEWGTKNGTLVVPGIGL